MLVHNATSKDAEAVFYTAFKVAECVYRADFVGFSVCIEVQ